MDKKKLIAVLSILFMLFVSETILMNIKTSSAILTYENIKVSSDQTNTLDISNFDWGQIRPGSTQHKTVYVKNQCDAELVLNLETVNWNPVVSSEYIILSWDREGYALSPGESVQAIVTLYASPRITSIYDFSFQTLIHGIQSDNIIVDDEDAVFKGTWSTASQLVPGFYGVNYASSINGQGDTATFNFIIPRSGIWEVYAWWSSAPSRATDTPYTINHADGTTTIDVNQEVNGSQWNSLGLYSFTEGESSIVVTDYANDYVIADAIKLVYKNSYLENVSPCVDYLHVWGYPDSVQLDPAGTISTGGRVRIYSCMSDPETPVSDLDAVFSYKPHSSGTWTTATPSVCVESKSRWYADWDIPGDAVTGLYDVRVEVVDPDGGWCNLTELGEFTVVDGGVNSDPVVEYIHADGIASGNYTGGLLDPGGEIPAGEKVHIYSRVSDQETSSSDLTVSISYKSPTGDWVPSQASYRTLLDYWHIYWLIPGDAVTGLYDVRVEVTDEDLGSTTETNLEAFEVINNQ